MERTVRDAINNAIGARSDLLERDNNKKDIEKINDKDVHGA